MVNDNPRVIVMDLPTKIKGFVYLDSTFTPCIVLNARMPREIQKKTYRHEIQHIRRGELTDTDYKEYML